MRGRYGQAKKTKHSRKIEKSVSRRISNSFYLDRYILAFKTELTKKRFQISLISANTFWLLKSNLQKEISNKFDFSKYILAFKIELAKRDFK